jgi:hypothetical protein
VGLRADREGHNRYRPTVMRLEDGQATVGNPMLAGSCLSVYPVSWLDHAANLPKASSPAGRRADAPE